MVPNYFTFPYILPSYINKRVFCKYLVTVTRSVTRYVIPISVKYHRILVLHLGFVVNTPLLMLTTSL